MASKGDTVVYLDALGTKNPAIVTAPAGATDTLDLLVFTPAGTYFKGAVAKDGTQTTANTWADSDTSAGISFANVGSSPSAAGASISGEVVTLQPADATHPGLVSASAQSFGGAKTFGSGVIADSVTSATATTVAITSSMADGASAIAAKTNTSAAWSNASAKLLDIQNNSVSKASFDKDGLLTAPGIHATGGSTFDGNITTSANVVGGNGSTVNVFGRVADGGTAIGLRLGNYNALTTAGARVVQFNATLGSGNTDIKSWVTKDGTYGSNYTDISGTPGTGTVNTTTGRFKIANGTGSGGISFTCTPCVSTSLVLVQIETNAAGVCAAKVVPGSGAFVVTTLNGTGVATNVTADCQFSFIVFNGA